MAAKCMPAVKGGMTLCKGGWLAAAPAPVAGLFILIRKDLA